MDESEFIFLSIQDDLHRGIENLENVIARTDVRCNRPKKNLTVLINRYQMQNEKTKPVWMLRGLLWGGFMFLVMEIATPFADGIPLETGKVLMKLVLWIVVGLAYGYTVHLVERRKS